MRTMTQKTGLIVRSIAKMTIGVAVLIVLMLAPSRIAAQNNSPSKHKTLKLSGCIQRGDAVSDYKLLTKDGVWNLTSAKVDIGPHTDHTVTVTGNVVQSFETKTEAKEGDDPNRRGILSVTKIIMISSTCAP